MNSCHIKLQRKPGMAFFGFYLRETEFIKQKTFPNIAVVLKGIEHTGKTYCISQYPNRTLHFPFPETTTLFVFYILYNLNNINTVV